MTIKFSNSHNDFDELARLIDASKVAIDAGHYSPRLKRIRQKSDLNQDYPIIVNVEKSFELLGCEFDRVPVSTMSNVVPHNAGSVDESRNWIIFDSYQDFLNAKLSDCFYFQFTRPTITERNTFEIAVQHSLSLADRQISSTLFVLLGDVWVCPELRPYCEKFAYKHYLRVCREIGGVTKIEIIKESKCKNKGDQRILKKWGKIPSNIVKREKLYESIGGTVVQTSKDAPLFFTSHALLRDSLNDYQSIALTKSKRPSCAVTLAGKFMVLEQLGYNFSLSVHDYSDDPQINQKVIEGALLAVHFGRQTLTKFLIDVYDGTEFAESTVIDAKDYQLMKHKNGIDELIATAFLGDVRIKSKFNDERVIDTYCALTGKRSR